MNPTLTDLSEKLALEGGMIVSSHQCTAMEIAFAKAELRMAVTDDGLGFIWRPAIRKMNALQWLQRNVLLLKQDGIRYDINAGGTHSRLFDNLNNGYKLANHLNNEDDAEAIYNRIQKINKANPCRINK